jgi:hypothetical protein
MNQLKSFEIKIYVNIIGSILVERIIKYYPNFTWINDKVIKDGCSKRDQTYY